MNTPFQTPCANHEGAPHGSLLAPFATAAEDSRAVNEEYRDYANAHKKKEGASKVRCYCGLACQPATGSLG